MSARERQGEYAVLKTMGFRTRHLAGLILGESLLLALAGGLVGEALTFPAVHFFKTALGQYFRVFPLTRATLALALGVALLVGLLAALLPAWRANRVSIAAVAYGSWFGGTYIDERHFFRQFAVDVDR